MIGAGYLIYFRDLGLYTHRVAITYKRITGIDEHVDMFELKPKNHYR